MKNKTQELTQTDDIMRSQRNVLRFLVLNDCKHGSLHTLKALSLLIAKNMHETLNELKTEYALLCYLGNTPDTVRSKLIYCIRRNYDALRAAVQRAYRYDMDEFYGIKAFIDQVSFVFDSFARK
ncbi:MAG: hypothetical protein HFE46_00970 [Clostridia bacterium]|nr:hypothetical protein [Clostridia bacterium]